MKVHTLTIEGQAHIVRRLPAAYLELAGDPAQAPHALLDAVGLGLLTDDQRPRWTDRDAWRRELREWDAAVVLRLGEAIIAHSGLDQVGPGNG